MISSRAMCMEVGVATSRWEGGSISLNNATPLPVAVQVSLVGAQQGSIAVIVGRFDGAFLPLADD
jgi:hypothetical protein